MMPTHLPDAAGPAARHAGPGSRCRRCRRRLSTFGAAAALALVAPALLASCVETTQEPQADVASGMLPLDCIRTHVTKTEFNQNFNAISVELSAPPTEEFWQALEREGWMSTPAGYVRDSLILIYDPAAFKLSVRQLEDSFGAGY